MSASKLLPVVGREGTNYEADDWIPEPDELSNMYVKLFHSRSGSDAYHILQNRFLEIGSKTFSEGLFDGILLRACHVGNMEIVSSLLKIFTKHFSIDRLIVPLSSELIFILSITRHRLNQFNRAEIRFKGLRNDKVSLLHSAAEGLKLKVVKILLSAGAEVNNPSSWSITPLISALLLSGPNVLLAREKTLACLIDSGANVHYRDADGLTPLMYAAKSSCLRSVQMLLQAGADPYAMDKEGCTALHYACLFKCTAVVKHLLGIAPLLLLVRGEHSSAYLAPYLTSIYMELNDPFWTSNDESADQSVMQWFLNNPYCPPGIKIDLKLLRVVSKVIFRGLYVRRLIDIDSMVQLVESAIAMDINSNIAAPVPAPIPAYGNYSELAVIEEIKSIDPASPLREQQLVLQSLVTAERCFGYASIPIMRMLSACLGRSEHKTLNKIMLALAMRLSEMLLFRLQNTQCLTQTSWDGVITASHIFINMAATNTSHILLDTAISLFLALVHSQQRVSTSCIHMMHSVLYRSSQFIIDSVASVDITAETTQLIAKLASSDPLLVNTSYGYLESLLHIALSRRRMPTLPVLETFLKCGGCRWINSPGVKGCRPLHLGGTREVASLLVDYGAHLDAVDADGSIPKYSSEYYRSYPRPLSCIVARFVVETGGIMEHEVGLLPTRVQAFLSLHDSHATRSQMERQAAESY